MDEGDQHDQENEPYRALLTVTRSNELIAVAVGSCVRVWDVRYAHASSILDGNAENYTCMQRMRNSFF